MRKLIVVIFAAAAVLAAGASVAGLESETSSEPQDFELAQTRIELVPLLSGLSSPIYLTDAHDGTNRLFIVEQPGRIRVLQPGAASSTVFLDITQRVLAGGERGLLGLAFHPQFPNTNRFFVNYTRRNDGATVIAEYRVSSNPNVADQAETVLLTVPQPFSNHNGGMIEFGPDGFLYIAMGDGGSANDPQNRAQNVNELLGKILRIDVNRSEGGQLYASPPSNPFFGATQGRDEIFALGVRNPWRFSFDRNTGDLFVGDVGQNAIEEIDIITLGGNYGWRVFEGTQCTNLNPGLCGAGGFSLPITQYNHTGGRCSVTGGYVYRGVQSSLPFGSYVFADFCTGEIFLFENGATRLLLDTPHSISSFGEDEAGEFYVCGLGGTVHRIVNSDPPPPSGDLRLNSFFLRHRIKLNVIDPVPVRPNGKKYQIVVDGTGFAEGAVVVVGGVEMVTEPGSPASEQLIARLRRPTLAQPGTLTVEVVNPNGARSNALMLQVLP
jgi:hypothetical protein